MPRLTVLIGPAGSGKTHRVLSEAARLALTAGLPSPAHPPLLVIVPEQQAVTIERALLVRLQELSGGEVAASARLSVMSLTRLAHVLAERAGERLSPLDDLGRQLLVWRLLDDVSDPAERQARATVLADQLAELALYGTSAGDLRRRARELMESPVGDGDPRSAELAPEAARKLTELAQLLDAYSSECAARGLDHSPVVAGIARLLSEDNWPLLAATRVWVDGFAGFTPAEESALTALLTRCAQLTATLLIDPTRRAGPVVEDVLDWYQPSRDTYRRWRALAASAGAQVTEVRLPDSAEAGAMAELPRWPAGSPLAHLALSGPVTAAAPRPAAAGSVEAVVCADERAEVDAAARRILDLAAGGLRFREISVVGRGLEPYADLVRTRFAEHGIPCFLDTRRPLAQHPAVELVRDGLRLALGQAGEEDVYSLLRTGLLPAEEDDDIGGNNQRERVDQLENYARAHGLRPGHWLADEAWHWSGAALAAAGSEDGAEAEGGRAATELLDRWRRQLLAPVIALKVAARGREDSAPTVRDVLAACWRQLLPAEVARRLEDWAAAAESARPPRPEEAEAHRRVLPLLAELFDELAMLAGDVPLDAQAGLGRAELCAWLESGLAALSLGQPPAGLDSVLVTDIERGRHHPVRATLLLGLCDGSWPPAVAEDGLLSDAERGLINGDGDLDERRLVSRGAAERSEREPYLALVAMTRASELLYLSRPAAEREGGRRQPSLFYSGCREALGVEERIAGSLGEAAEAESIGTPADLAVAVALRGDAAADRLLRTLGERTAAALAALSWGRRLGDPAVRHARLPAETTRQLLGMDDASGSPVLRASPSRLEAFAACPYKHCARYYLRLASREEAVVDTRLLGGFYHRVLQAAIDQLNESGYQWPGSVGALRGALEDALGTFAGELQAASGMERAEYVLTRARILLGQLALRLHGQFSGEQRQPRFTEMRFGPREDWPACTLAGDGLSVELHGVVDRLDLGPDGGATVVDYKLRGARVNWARFLAGQQLQLPAYLLAVGTPGAAGEVRPVAAEYQPVEPRWQSNGEADFAPQRVPPVMKKAEQQDRLAGLLPEALNHTQRIIGELAERMLAGEVGPLPLLSPREKGWTACGLCDYRSVCRFDPLAGERYRQASGRGDAELRDAIAAGGDFSGSARGDGPEVQR